MTAAGMARPLRAGLLLLTALLAGLCAPGGAAGTDWKGFGPLPVRNYQPVRLIFLDLPLARAATLPPGGWAVYVESVESNTIATEQGRIEGLLKFETNRTVLGARLGVWPHAEIGVDVPFVSRFGGFMDPVMDEVERKFGLVNPERRLFPDNAFGGFFLARGGVPLFAGPRQQLALGDVWLSGQYEVWRPARLPLLALRAAVKLPTGSAATVVGSGHPDGGVGLAAEYGPLRWLRLYQNLNLIVPGGPVTPARLSPQPFVTEGFALEARLARWAAVLLQQEAYTSPLRGTGSPILDGTTVELTAGLNLSWKQWLLQIGGINNVSGVATAADFSLFARLTVSGSARGHADAPTASLPLRDAGRLAPAAAGPHAAGFSAISATSSVPSGTSAHLPKPAAHSQ